MLLRSKPGNVMLAKVWGSVLCAGSGLLIVGSDVLNRRSLLALPLFFASLFTASIASFELRDGIFRYKRLFKWNTIPDNAIVDARIEWPPVLGSVRLKRFMFPWGRLYFVLDGNTNPNPFLGGEYPLLRALRMRPGIKIDSGDLQGHETRNGPRPNVKVALSTLAGVLSYSVTNLLIPREHSQPASFLGGPSIIRAQWSLIQLLENPKTVLVLSLIFALLAIYRYRRHDAWIFAFLAGFSLTHIVVHGLVE
jgi:hypothetical protein